MEPLNYQFADPSAAIVNGLKMGATLNQIEAQRQQQQLAQQAAMQQAADLRALSMNPNAGHADYAAVMTKYPALAENLGKAFKVMDEGQQKNLLNFQSRVYAAQQAGNNDLAVELLEERAKADPQQAQHYTTMARMIREAPAAARTITALSLAGAMGADKFADTFGKLGTEQRAAEQAPADLRKKNADATTAEAGAVIKTEEAKVAPQAVLLDLQKKGWDITKIQADIEHAKQANRIAAMNAATAREGNDLKRRELQLKVQEAEQKLADGIRGKVADVEAARTSIDNLLNTADRFLKVAVDPKTGKPTATVRAATGPIDSRIPTLQTDVADLEALAETLSSQAFMAQIPNLKGMGALSNAEGEKLQAALQNLKLSQSADQLVANVKEAQRLIMKGRKNLVTRYGVPESVPDTPAAASAAGANEIDALVKKYTGGGK